MWSNTMLYVRVQSWIKDMKKKDGFFFVFDMSNSSSLTEVAVLYDKVLSIHQMEDKTPWSVPMAMQDVREDVLLF